MIAVIVVVAMGGAVLFLNKAKRRPPTVVVAVQEQPAALEAPTLPAPPALELDVGSGEPGAIPGAHSSCADAFARYAATNPTRDGPPIPEGALAKVLNDGGYLEPCAVSPALTVNVCAAIQDGKAVGVTISTTPVSPVVETCIAEQLRALPFPSYPQMQLRTATFLPPATTLAALRSAGAAPATAGAAQPSALAPRPQVLLPPVPPAPTPAAPPPEEPYID